MVHKLWLHPKEIGPSKKITVRSHVKHTHTCQACQAWSMCSSLISEREDSKAEHSPGDGLEKGDRKLRRQYKQLENAAQDCSPCLQEATKQTSGRGRTGLLAQSINLLN